MILNAQNITKSYPTAQGQNTILKGIHLSLNMGESMAICGRSGEGKTTLLHILGTLEAPDHGTLRIDSSLVIAKNGAEIRNRCIGFVFQSCHLLEDFSTLENVLMPARIARRFVKREYGMDLLDLLVLADKAELPEKYLSGGEKQRVAIARALCNDPKLILADEPTGNLDRENGYKIGQILISLKKSLILVTHDPELAKLCSKQYQLREGQLRICEE